MRMPRKINVDIKTDAMGNIIASPVSKKYAKAFSDVRRENGGGSDLNVFFQEGGPATQFLNDLTPRQRREINKGWDVRIKVDPWIVGHWYGYDAHTVAESVSLRDRGYVVETGSDIDDVSFGEKSLFELNMSTWKHEMEWGADRWKYAKEMFDYIEGRMAKKVYSVLSKVLKKDGSIEMAGEMKGVGPFVIKMDHKVKPNSRTGATREHVQIIIGKDGKNDKVEKLFGATAGDRLITKWVMRELNDRR